MVSETFNSNSLKLIAGAYLPTVFMAVGAISSMVRLSLWWLTGSTLSAAICLLARGSLGRPAGLALIGLCRLCRCRGRSLTAPHELPFNLRPAAGPFR